MRRRAIANLDRQHPRIYHACYTTHIQSILAHWIRGDVWICVWSFVLIRYIFLFAHHRRLLHMLNLVVLCSCVYVSFKNKNKSSRKSYRNNNEQRKAFFMTRPTEWIDFPLCWARSENNSWSVFSASKRWTFAQEQDLYMASCRIFDDPSYWMDTFSKYDNPGRTVDVGMCMRAHTHTHTHTHFTQQFKVRAAACVYVC